VERGSISMVGPRATVSIATPLQ